MSACPTAKVQFDSWELATKVRGHHIRDHAGPCEVYRCDACGKWHIGTRLHKTVNRRPKVEEREETR